MPSLIQSDIVLCRKRYDQALELQGIEATYQFPLYAKSNTQGEPVIDSYSPEQPTHVFFEGTPKVKTYKRYGWVVENDNELLSLIHCSFHLPSLQKDCIFKIHGQYADIPDKVFRVTELSYDLQAPDHIACQIIPVFDKQYVGRTEKEVTEQFSTSNHFLKIPIDYRGNYQSTKEDVGGSK